ncbi:hypothetical protein ACIHFE_09800 [Streptomyces sp. NPDC052396]|uniref:hypothetical protein n=1 Tax=Streptomyces sp. NPDC052396 TaxID=3365689 RepID=UPI0037D0657C
MTPYSLAFYLHVVTSGSVLGARPADTPQRVAELLGTDFAENSFDDQSMWRDYGLVEFFWDRQSAGQPWSGHHFTVQVHRLAHGASSVPGALLRSRYGRFDRRLRFAKLRRLSERRGTELVEVPHVQAPCYRTFWQPESLTSVTVIGAHEEYVTPGNLRVGDVYSIGAPTRPEKVECGATRVR